jgi:hypothetical protein
MIIHLVVFRWKPGITSEQIAALERGLGGLPGSIAALREYRFGKDLGLREGNADFGIVATVDDADGLTAYLEHPEHRRVVEELVRPIVELRLAAQISPA